MKEGPEALVGGPPLSLSEGPAFSAFRLGPQPGMPPHSLGECALSPHPDPLALDSPVCLVKTFLQQLSRPLCFFHGAAPARGQASWRGEEGMNGGLWVLAFWFLPRPTLLPHSAFEVYKTSSHLLSPHSSL